MLLKSFFEPIIRQGTLTLIDTDGRRHQFGDGKAPRSTLRLHDWTLRYRLPLNPYLVIGEAYMDGGITAEEGDIYDFLDLVFRNIGRDVTAGGPVVRLLSFLRWLARRFRQYNPAHRARRNVEHHYDLSDGLYGLFLDDDWQYSCGYFEHPNDSLEDAQLAKKRHIAAKLQVEPGNRILDIGSGWGGLSRYLSNTCDAEVLGITLSSEQYRAAQERSEKDDSAKRTQFALMDYRDVEGTFDRIVSVGMFEHVGVGHYGTFFRKVERLLDDDGIVLLHSIGRADGPGATNPWMEKYIFPGAYTPALSEVLPAIERAGLMVTDVEVLRLHYAQTLREWRRRFLARKDEARALYDERFCRMWEFYLAGCEVSFRYDGLVVFQIQLVKNQSVLPLTRDYITDWERAESVAANTDHPARRVS